MTQAFPKPVRIKSKALTNSANGQNCALRWGDWTGSCGGDVVFCHVRGKGDGVATKPPDFWGFFGCQVCHAYEEAGHVPADEILRAIRETQTLMAMEGLLQVRGWKP
jgi:hypothetical protein